MAKLLGKQFVFALLVVFLVSSLLADVDTYHQNEPFALDIPELRLGKLKALLEENEELGLYLQGALFEVRNTLGPLLLPHVEEFIRLALEQADFSSKAVETQRSWHLDEVNFNKLNEAPIETIIGLKNIFETAIRLNKTLMQNHLVDYRRCQKLKAALYDWTIVDAIIKQPQRGFIARFFRENGFLHATEEELVAELEGLSDEVTQDIYAIAEHIYLTAPVQKEVLSRALEVRRSKRRKTREFSDVQVVPPVDAVVRYAAQPSDVRVRSAEAADNPIAIVCDLHGYVPSWESLTESQWELMKRYCFSNKGGKGTESFDIERSDSGFAALKSYTENIIAPSVKILRDFTEVHLLLHGYVLPAYEERQEEVAALEERVRKQRELDENGPEENIEDIRTALEQAARKMRDRETQNQEDSALAA